jgi:predicted RNase H-like nuclease (RuvC/YqgF family)
MVSQARLSKAQIQAAERDNDDLRYQLREAEARVKELEEALEDIASGRYSGVLLTSFPPKDPAVERARAALAQQEM